MTDPYRPIVLTGCIFFCLAFWTALILLVGGAL